MPSIKFDVDFTDDALKHLDTKGRYKIDYPEIVNGKMQFGSHSAETLRFICQAPYVRREGTIDVCRNPMKTIVGSGTGDQTEIVECGKCRSQYIMRTVYNDQGNVTFNVSVWDIGRKIAEKGKLWTDLDDYSAYVKFGRKK